MPEDGAHSPSFVSASPEQTQQFGERLGRLIRPGDVICLSGELGAGKTSLAIGIGRGWGARERVTSPTFILVNEYSRDDGGRLYHVDAYRLRDAADSDSIALSDLLGDRDSALMVEWPERVTEALPRERLWIRLEWRSHSERRVAVAGHGSRYEAMAARLA